MRDLLAAPPEDRRPLHEVVDRWRARHGAIEEPCVCGGPDIRAVSGSDQDVIASVQRHQIEPVHIAYDIAQGIPLSGPQLVARGVDGYQMSGPVVALVGGR